MPACASNLGAVCLGRPATAMWLMVTQEQQSWLSTAHLFQHALGSPVSGTGRPTQSAQSQRPNDRAADDVSRDCAHREDQKCHGVSLLGRWTDPQGCPAFRAPGQPRRPQTPSARVCGLRDCPADAFAYRSPSARTIGRERTQPVMQQATMTSAMMASKKTRRHHGPLRERDGPRRVEKSSWTNERPDMRGVAPSLFGKPLLGKGLSPHPLTADVSALLPVPILQHPWCLGNGADGIRTRTSQGDNLLLCQLSYRPNGTNWYPPCAFVRRTDTVRWRPSKPPAVLWRTPLRRLTGRAASSLVRS